MISFNCVQCGKKFLTPEHLAGRQGKCQRCGTLYTIPQPDAPMEQPTPHGATGEFVAAQAPPEEPPEPPPPPEPETPKIRFKCEECGRKFAMSTHLVGNAGTCPDCGTMFLVPPYSDGEAPPPRPMPPPPPPMRQPTATVPAVQVTAHPTPTRTSKPTTMMPAPQFRAGVEPQRTSKPTATMAAVAPAPQAASKATATLPAAGAPKPSSLVEARSEKPYLVSASSPSGGGGAKGLVAALLLCSVAAGGAFWAWKKISDTSVPPNASGTNVAATPNPPAPVPAPKPPTNPVTFTPPPPEEPVLTPPPEEPTPPEWEDPPYVEPAPPSDPTNPPSSDPPTPFDPASLKPPVPEAAQVEAALADFARRREYVKDCPDAVQCARALDALSGVVVDARAIEILGKILTSPSELPLVRQRAAELLGNSLSTEAVPALSAGFEACREDTSVARAAVVSLGRIDSAASAKALSAIMRGWTKATSEERDHMYASVALVSLSALHRSESVDAVLGFWAGLAAAKPADTSRLSEAEWKRESHRVALEDSARGTLSVLTGQALASYEEWKAWWEQNRGSFK